MRPVVPQNAQPIGRLPQTDHQRRNRCFRLGQARNGLFDVERVRLSLPEPGLGDLERPLLNFHIVPGVNEPLLERANLHIRRGHVREKRDHGIAIGFHRAVESAFDDSTARRNRPQKSSSHVALNPVVQTFSVFGKPTGPRKGLAFCPS